MKQLTCKIQEYWCTLHFHMALRHIRPHHCMFLHQTCTLHRTDTYSWGRLPHTHLYCRRGVKLRNFDVSSILTICLITAQIRLLNNEQIPFPHLSSSQPPGILGTQAGRSLTIWHSWPSGHRTSSQVGHAALTYSELRRNTLIQLLIVNTIIKVLFSIFMPVCRS